MERSLAPLSQYIAAGIDAVIPSNACGNVLRASFEINNLFVPAADVYDCYNSVPFNPGIASVFLDYWNDTVQFQSTLEYLKHPLPGYQKPAVDLVECLDQLQTTVSGDGFPNQYRFEANFHNILRAAGDPHLAYNSGVMSAFLFGTSNGLTSLSIDGKELPKVYITGDLELNQTNPDPSWQPSAVTQIGGDDVIDYITRFAALNSYGTLEPNADWNMVFDNPANYLVTTTPLPLWNFGATYYPGNYINYTFENGSTFQDVWNATYNGPAGPGPLETGGDFFNLFVSNLIPAACNGTSPPPSCPLVDPDSNSGNPIPASTLPIPYAYPQNAAVSTPGISGLAGPVLGYLLHEQSLGVLILPTFLATGYAIEAFVNATQEFIQKAKQGGMTKILIDLQQNDGGDTLLPYLIFRQFFPNIDPYGGSELRAQPLADAIGRQLSPFWTSLASESPDLYASGSSNQWIAMTKLNATGTNFTSWSQFFGPYFNGVDDFSAVQRYNLSNVDYVSSSFSNTIDFDSVSDLITIPLGDAPFAAEDIVMLSDGLCSSACALFMEMMHHEAGVKNVVIGGRPSTGPMQTPSGSRGAKMVTLDQLDKDIYNAVVYALAHNLSIPQAFDERGQQSVYFSQGGGFTLRSQVRKNSTTPLEMIYEAADCRLFWTPDTFNNFTNLWIRAATAIWTSPEDLCVANSTGYASTSAPPGGQPKPPPDAVPLPAVNYTSQGLPWLSFPGGDVPFLGNVSPDVDGFIPVYISQRFEPHQIASNLGNPGFNTDFPDVYEGLGRQERANYQYKYGQLSLNTQTRLKYRYQQSKSKEDLKRSIDGAYPLESNANLYAAQDPNAPPSRRRKRSNLSKIKLRGT